MSLKYFLVDLQSASKTNSIFVNLKWFVFSHSLHLLFLFRLGQDLRKCPIFGKLFGFVIEYAIRLLYASDISCYARVGEGFTILHGHDIVIGSDVVIGKYCRIFNGVTLGNKDTTKSSIGEQPTIGNNVTLSTGAKILGNVVIGDNVIVGANAVVVKSFPNNVKIGGVPAKIIGLADVEEEMKDLKSFNIRI